ncbi:hypothetical protein O3P69_020157 [Scylla paramamosain]|uniref:Uncharacterized protein n=1 Tax=Scylla paramamosain TaxID=85552 RepID=A0AAW0TL21_SCYPA
MDRCFSGGTKRLHQARRGKRLQELPGDEQRLSFAKTECVAAEKDEAKRRGEGKYHAQLIAGQRGTALEHLVEPGANSPSLADANPPSLTGANQPAFLAGSVTLCGEGAAGDHEREHETVIRPLCNFPPVTVSARVLSNSEGQEL